MNQAYTPQRLPETMTPQEIGAHMAGLRQQFNLTQQEVSERLHIRTRYVSAIEEGKYELMPGKVYARGYVHTYAEFLGLDPEQVVSLCFAGELPANAQPIPASAIPRPATVTSIRAVSTSPSHWRGYAVMGAVALVIVLIISQVMGRGGDSVEEQASVAPVPEAILASVRNMVMPLPNNYACLTTDNPFECFAADNTTRMLDRLHVDGLHYGGEIDVSSLLLSLPEAPETEGAPVEDAAPVETEETAPAAAKEDDKSDTMPAND